MYYLVFNKSWRRKDLNTGFGSMPVSNIDNGLVSAHWLDDL